ncbi:MAG: NAD-dependent epimerase/dehydratase family protein [Pseudomonadota bacterium]
MAEPSSQTILVTGATGYIAKYIVAGLLARGHNVVGSARSEARDGEIREAITPLLEGEDWQGRYRTLALDLSKDDGWEAAMAGVDALFHTASPFPLEQPKDENELIGPAVEGARRALRAAVKAGVARVIFTSSTVSITTKEMPQEGSVYTEADWSDVTRQGVTAYAKSKTLAERAAWDFVKDHPEIQMTVINPSFVVGPPLGQSYGTSIEVIERLYNGKDPMLPRVGFPAVDVRDVAEAHIRAFERPESAGERFALAERFMWFSDMARAVKEAVPHRKVALREAPNFLIRFLSLFDASIRTILPDLGRERMISADKAKTVLGLEFRNVSEAISAAARWIDTQKSRP